MGAASPGAPKASHSDLVGRRAAPLPFCQQTLRTRREPVWLCCSALPSLGEPDPIARRSARVQAHQGRIDVPASLEPRRCPHVLNQIELGIAPASGHPITRRFRRTSSRDHRSMRALSWTDTRSSGCRLWPSGEGRRAARPWDRFPAIPGLRSRAPVSSARQS